MKEKSYFSEQLAKHICGFSYDTISKEILAQTKRLFIDFLGLTITGHQSPITQATKKFVLSVAGKGPASFISSVQPVSADWAAYVDATSTHTLDFDDTYYQGFIHPGAVVFSTAMAMSQEVGASYQQFIKAVIIGYDVAVCMSRAQVAGNAHKALLRGFNLTATSCCLPAAAITASLLSLDLDKTAIALCIACYNTGGVCQAIDDSVPWALSTCLGWSAHAGILAAKAAAAGVRCEKSTIEGKYGYLNGYSWSLDKAKQLLTVPQTPSVSEVSIKCYPCCGVIQSAISGLLDLREAHQLMMSDIKNITIKVNSTTFADTSVPDHNKRNPKNANDAMLSLPFSAAVCLQEGYLDSELYGESYLNDPNVLELSNRMVIECDSSLDAQLDCQGDFPANICIETLDDQVFQTFVHYPKGDFRNPMTDDEVQQKFHHLTEKIFSEEIRQKILHIISGQEEFDIKRLIDYVNASMENSKIN